MNKTSIGWTDFSSSPLKYRGRDGKTVWACVKHSAGCANCYAETLAMRYGRGLAFTAANMKGLTPFLDEKELAQLLRSQKITGKRVFLEDMSDLFGDWVPDELIDRVFAVCALRPDVSWQILTKRARRAYDYFAEKYQSPNFQILNGMPVLGEPTGELNEDREDRVKDAASSLLCYLGGNVDFFYDVDGNSHVMRAPWPLPNVHLGVSVENQYLADERIPWLLRTPAATRWISAEPLLGPIVLDSGPGRGGPPRWLSVECDHPEDRKLDWVVVGGESGGKRRPCEVEWITSIVNQCHAAGVPAFVKQDAAFRSGDQGRIPLEVWNVKEFPK